MSRSSALSVERGQPSARAEEAAWPAPARAARTAGTLRLAGVPLRADLSCAFGGALTAWTFASGILPEADPGRALIAYWVAGVAGAMLVMGSLLLHEVGHAIAARRRGLRITRLTLSFVGGTCEVLGALRHARDELVIAVAGPLASLAVALTAALVHVALVETVGPGLPATVAALVAGANLAVAALNAVPGLPLDGGRVLRAAMWSITGRPDAATGVAALAGRRFGEGLIVMAVLASAFGFVALALWAALLGLVLRES
jgi:Zn-dependent protease